MGTETIGRKGIEAKVVEDSISKPSGVRLITLTLKYPRFIHAELMTHRMFTRNASSSRAIPIDKLISKIAQDPAEPIHWGANQRGMKADQYNDEPVRDPTGQYDLTPDKAWHEAKDDALDWADRFKEAGYHKQVVNRLTEPFQFMHTIVTATEWDNFFNLRYHEDAQPEIHELARVMHESIKKSVPKFRNIGQWHLPMVDEDERQAILRQNYSPAMISAARCARVSYTNHEGTRDLEKDIDLANRLYNAGHMCPFEHQATPIPTNGINDSLFRYCNMKSILDDSRWCNNFREWSQARYLLAGGYDV